MLSAAAVLSMLQRLQSSSSRDKTQGLVTMAKVLTHSKRLRRLSFGFQVWYVAHINGRLQAGQAKVS